MRFSGSVSVNLPEGNYKIYDMGLLTIMWFPNGNPLFPLDRGSVEDVWPFLRALPGIEKMVIPFI